ncbi:MAG: hypothetical protein IPN42_03060 [Methylococcaceae bacterium]|nr:hypothetical protein [Methylococcaceae bacterium]
MKRLLFYILLSHLLSGCEAKHLAYVHETTLGIDVAASADTGTGRFVLGYDSDTYAIVPRKGSGQDAMSLASMGCISASGLDQVTFNHFVSSGDAAKKLRKMKKS